MNTHELTKLTQEADASSLREYIGQADTAGTGKVNLAHVRLFFSFVKPHIKIALCGAMMLILSTGATLMGPRVLGHLVDEAFVKKDTNVLWVCLGILCVLQLLRFVATAGNQYFLASLGQSVMQSIRTALLRHLTKIPMRKIDTIPSGQLVTRLTNDIGALQEMFTSGFIQIIDQFFVVVAIVVMVCVLQIELAFYTIGFYPLFFIGAYFLSAHLHRAYRYTRQLLSALNAALSEHLSAMSVVHVFGRRTRQFNRLAALNESYIEAQLVTMKLRALLHPTMTLMGGLSVLLLLGVGAPMVRSGEIEVGLLVTFFGYLIWIHWPLIQMVDRWNTVLSGFAALERIFEAFSWEAEELTANTHVVPDQITGHVVFEDVWFAYNENDWVLKGVSFELSAGARFGFVGPTGCGKSSIVKLLLRFYEPQRGRILIDGVDIREYPLGFLRAQLALVQQDVSLFSGTIEDNVFLWSERDEESLDYLLGRLSLDRKVEEGGENLSLGERQLITFARAAAAKPSLWILDEATAHLDPSIEADIGSFLTEQSKDTTTLLVAHRLSSVRDADKIFVINHGEVIEEGTHEQLVAQEGLYARLVSVDRQG